MRTLALFFLLTSPLAFCQQATVPAAKPTAKIAPPTGCPALMPAELAQVRIANLKIENSNLRALLLQTRVQKLTAEVQSQQQAAAADKVNLVNSLAERHSVDLTKFQLDEAKGEWVAVAAKPAAPASTPPK